MPGQEIVNTNYNRILNRNASTSYEDEQGVARLSRLSATLLQKSRHSKLHYFSFLMFCHDGQWRTNQGQVMRTVIRHELGDNFHLFSDSFRTDQEARHDENSFLLGRQSRSRSRS